jgi:hypothetical protein
MAGSLEGDEGTRPRWHPRRMDPQEPSAPGSDKRNARAVHLRVRIRSSLSHWMTRSSIMTPEELSITEKDATELIELMSAGKLKSYDVTLAFCVRALASQLFEMTMDRNELPSLSSWSVARATVASKLNAAPQLNCLSEVFFEEGLARAKEIDDILAKTGKPVRDRLLATPRSALRRSGHSTACPSVSRPTGTSKAKKRAVRSLRSAGPVLMSKQLATWRGLTMWRRKTRPPSRSCEPPAACSTARRQGLRL